MAQLLLWLLLGVGLSARGVTSTPVPPFPDPRVRYYYTYSSETNVLGLHNVTTVIKFHLTPVNHSEDSGCLLRLNVDAFSQHSDFGYDAGPPEGMDFSKSFLFQREASGEVTSVHHHPEEQETVLLLKKVLAGTFGLRLQPGEGSQWTYEGRETDHHGDLLHSYSVTEGTSGMTLTRFHKSNHDVARTHEKVMHVTREGIIQTVHCHDHVLLDKNKGRNSEPTIRFPGEKITNYQDNDDFPTIQSSSKTTVKFLYARPTSEAGDTSWDGLRQSTVQVLVISTKKVNFEKVEQKISKLLDCIAKHEDKTATNRTECVHQLRRTLETVLDDDVTALSERHVSRHCAKGDDRCEGERTLFIDLVAARGCDSCQRLVVERILRNPNASEDDLRRALVHFLHLTQPLPETIRAIQTLCFGQNDQLHGSTRLTATQRRACLTLGALVRTLHDLHNRSQADVIANKLESWLGLYNHSHSEPILRRRRRSASDPWDEVSHHHVLTKAVLIHSLANAQLPRSRRHIRSYLEPNRGASLWRRGAIRALVNSTCQESLLLLFDAVAHDLDPTVRLEAGKLYHQHPLRNHTLRERENLVLRRNYTYAAVARVRRAVLDISLDGGFSLKLQLPGVNWDKVIGTDQIGASFGLHMNNGLELVLKPLNGHFKVDVYDDAYAKAYINLIGIKVTFFQVKVCYRGSIEYDLNVFKDFGINTFEDLLNAFDRIFKSLTEPFGRVIDVLRQLMSPRFLEKILDELVRFVQNLPNLARDLVDGVVEMARRTAEFHGDPIIEKAKAIVAKVRSLFEEIRNDAIEFYNSISNTVTVTVTAVSKMVGEAVESTVDSLKTLASSPMQSIANIGANLQKVRIALGMLTGAKDKVLEAVNFLVGGKPLWLQMEETVVEVVEDLQELLQQVEDSIAAVLGQTSTAASTELVRTEGFQAPLEMQARLQEEVRAMFTKVIASLEPLRNAVRPFLDLVRGVTDLIKSIKEAYESFKQIVDRARSTIEKLFGPKFDPKFPTHRKKEESDQCPAGTWPSTYSGKFSSTGVQVMLNVGAKVRSPVDGTVVRQSETEVLITPTDPNFQQFHILLANVQPFANVTETPAFFQSGQPLGTALRSGCMPNYIHVAVREQGTQDVYVDPSPFLDRLIPIPQWIEECNDFLFEHIFKSADISAIGEEIQKATEDYKSAATKNMEDFVEQQTNKPPEPPYRPAFLPPSGSSTFSQSLKDSFQKVKEAFTDMKSFMASLGLPDGKDLLGFDKLTMTQVLDLLKDDGGVVAEIRKAMAGLAQKMREAPVTPPEGLSLFRLAQLLRDSGQPAVGDRGKMAFSLLTVFSKACPAFKDAVALEQGHLCTSHADCQGLTCGLALPLGPLRPVFSVDLRLSSGGLVVSFNSSVRVIPQNGTQFTIELPELPGLGIKVTLTLLAQSVGQKVKVSAWASVCSSAFGSCLRDVPVLRQLSLSLGVSGNFSTASGQDGYSARVDSLGLEDFLLQSVSFGLDPDQALKVMTLIRQSLTEQIFDVNGKLSKLVNEEFKEKSDLCISGRIPVPTFDFEPFPQQRIPFLVGPLLLTLGFGAGVSLGLEVNLGFCILSMKFKATLTPWVGAKVWGDLAVDLFLIRGGIGIEGYLLKTKFPLTAAIAFPKFPVDVTIRMDLELVPLELTVYAFVEVNLIFKRFTVFRGNIWHYRAPSITANIFNIENKGEDKSPPTIGVGNKAGPGSQRSRRDVTSGCSVTQLPGRDVTSPAFRLEAAASDPTSDVTVSFAVGTAPGGSDAMGWTELGGPSLTFPTSALPGGVPLYWTVKARNSQGLEAVTQCWLPTYDKTLPDGRVDAAFAISSRPDVLAGTVFVFEDSPLKFPQSHALGLAPSSSQSVLAWQPLSVSTGSERSDVTGDMRHFSPPKPGRLATAPLRTVKVQLETECVSRCVQYGGTCLAVSFEHAKGTCELHGVVESADVRVSVQGAYETMERLTAGHNSYIRYDDLDLQHGNVYFINVNVENALGYRSVLTSQGTMIDLTPPSPGAVGQTAEDSLVPQACQAAPTQRCVDVTPRPNHRIIIDGPGAATVFNGGKRGTDMKYTRINIFIRGHWDGFHDNETGIWGYTWAVGTKVCQDDVIKTADPHAHLFGPDFWTHSGEATNLNLPDGRYYQTVQALNHVVHGGSLVTTVCHAQPLIVDTTPPDFQGFQNFSFNFDLQLLKIAFRVDDDLSGIQGVDLGLGRTKYDVSVRGYVPLTFTSTPDVTAAVEDFVPPDGVPVWLLIRATNGALLRTSHHSDHPLLVDGSPPVAGQVLDGGHSDLDFQSQSSSICASWRNFHDEQSGILRFEWRVGTSPGADDVVASTSLPAHQNSHCANVSLAHNRKYYSTVVATNSALNPQTCNASSNGVLVDTTAPVAGTMKDGQSGTDDLDFTSERGLVQASWEGFRDPESGIRSYDVTLLINRQLKKEVAVNGSALTFEDHTVSLRHGDIVHFRLEAYNGAGASVEGATDGVTVDLTPPIMEYIRVAPPGFLYQAEVSSLHLAWQFSDPESGIKVYRVAVFEEHQGAKVQFWPGSGTEEQVSNGSAVERRVSGLALQNGARYWLQVTAVNGALFPRTERSAHVTVDSTPPSLLRVHLGLLSEEEVLDDQGRVMHADRSRLTVTWEATDPESGVLSVSIAVGTDLDPVSVTGGFRTFPADRPAILESLTLLTSAESNILYRVTAKVTNGAGVQSQEMKSRLIYVLAENTPGTVFDGDSLFTDADFQSDATAISASFSGFSSQACGISRYEWGVGSRPFLTDVMAYTASHVTMLNATAGFVAAHVTLVEGQRYYVTVKAVTGHTCHEQFILATSSGVALATTPPVVAAFTSEGQAVPDFSQEKVIFQNVTGSIDVIYNVTDAAKINRKVWCLGTLASPSDVMSCQQSSDVRLGHVTLPEGRATFLHVEVENEAGLQTTWRSAAILADTSPPAVEGLTCSPAVSTSRGLVTCQWQGLLERESRVRSLAVCVSTSDKGCSVMPVIPLSLSDVTWHGDVSQLIENASLSSVYVILQATNVVGLQRNTSARVLIDRTPPVAGRVSIVTSDVSSDGWSPAQCQVSTEFLQVLVQDFQDEDSGIASCHVALETTEGAADLLGFEPVTQGRVTLLTGLHLPDGGHVIAVARCSNNAGLFSQASSLPLPISSNPLLTVWDGNGQADTDFQTSLSSMAGRWFYSDLCPVVSAQWRLETLDGRDVIAFHDLALASTTFTSEVVDLKRDVTYVNVIRTVDALNRTREARSDGVAVRVEPPYPGSVRDGVDRDLDFQLSTRTLSVNWDRFGLALSPDPTQRIIRYEVAIGDGSSYTNGLYNIQPFTSVGLNLSATFTDLTLTPKNVTYFATVRAYSEAGGVAESSSNGVKVGYAPHVFTGVVDLPKFSASSETFTFTWSSFTSDLGMAEYKIALTGTPLSPPNETFSLRDWKESGALAESNLTSVGLDTMITFHNLTLVHGGEYYVTVFGIDQADRCGATTAGPLLVDLTAPERGNVSVTGFLYSNAVFVASSSEITVTWEGFRDAESGIATCTVSLLSLQSCSGDGGSTLATMEVSRDKEATFFELSLDTNGVFAADVTCVNGAGEKVTSRSRPVLVDVTPPSPGSVKVGSDWRRPLFLQNDTGRVQATVAVSTARSASCQTETLLFPSTQARSHWAAQGSPFSPTQVYLSDGKLYIAVGYDHTLTRVEKGGMKSSEFPVVEGNYTIRFRAARADHVVTSYIFGLPDRNPSRTFFYPRPSDESGTAVNTSSRSTPQPEKFSPDFGFTVAVYGWPSNGTWWCMTAIRDDLQEDWEWIRLPFDPTTAAVEYVFSVTRVLDDMAPTWSISVFVGGAVARMFRGVRLPGAMALYLEAVNNEDAPLPMQSPFTAAFTTADVTAVRVPAAPVPDCVYGEAFSDVDSGLRELWVGITDEENVTDSVSPMTLLRSFCRPCPSDGCALGCDPSCARSDPWRLLTVEVKGLTLIPGRGMNQSEAAAAATSLDSFSEKTYYVSVKAVNFAGISTVAKSNRFIVDVTPPTFEFLFCSDPVHSLDEAVEFVGSNSSIGAFWQCGEDVSSITRYTVAVGTSVGKDDVYGVTSVGKKSKVGLQLTTPLLQDGHTYYVTVRAENSAGLSSSLSCSVTVELSAPQVPADLENSTLYTSRELPDLHTALTSRQDRVGVVLPANHDPRVLYYEWELDSGQGPLFKKVAVGGEGATRLEVKDGDLYINGQRKNASLSQPANASTAEVTSPPPGGNYLRLEPGRCYFQVVGVVTRAHVTASTNPAPVCVKRDQDATVDMRTGGSEVTVALTGGATRRRRSVPTAAELASITFKGLDGAAVVGTLTEGDLKLDYGSSAAPSYRPYISPDFSATAPTSRVMAGRIVRYMNVSFFVSPTPYAVVEGRMRLELQQSLGEVSPGNVKVPLVWSSERYRWIHWDELCPADLTSDCQIGKPGGELTTPKFDVTTSVIYQPFHVGVFEVKQSLQNTAPVPATSSVSGTEDSLVEEQLTVTDAENDDVIFSLTSSGRHGTANVTEAGLIRYMPRKDFCGDDVIRVTVTEVNVPVGMIPNKVSSDVTVRVTCENDVPSLHFASPSQLLSAQATEEVTLVWRGRMTLLTSTLSLGHFLLTDPDLPDDLEIELDQLESQKVVLQVVDVTATSHGVDVTGWSDQTVRVFQLRLTKPSSVPNDLSLRLIGRDGSGFYSRALLVKVWFRDVLCNTGSCGRVSTSAMDRDEARKFLDYVPPTSEDLSVTVNPVEEGIDPSQPTMRVNATAVRVFLSSSRYGLDVTALRDRLLSLLAQHLAVPPASVSLTLQASDPALVASGSITEVIITASVSGESMTSVRLEQFLTASMSSLQQDLGITVQQAVPPDFDQQPAHITGLLVGLPLGCVFLAAVMVSVFLCHRKRKRGKKLKSTQADKMNLRHISAMGRLWSGSAGFLGSSLPGLEEWEGPAMENPAYMGWGDEDEPPVDYPQSYVGRQDLAEPPIDYPQPYPRGQDAAEPPVDYVGWQNVAEPPTDYPQS